MSRTKRSAPPGRSGANPPVRPQGKQGSRTQGRKLGRRLLAFLLRVVPWRHPLSPKPKSERPSPQALLLPGVPQKRTLAQWKERRRRTTAEVKAYLAQEQPLLAIKKLTRALLEDPQHPRYHQLLKKAVAQRHRRRVKVGRPDRWAELPADLKQEALQLEASSAYLDEIEQLFDKAGIPAQSAPPPPHGPMHSTKQRGGRKGTPQRRRGR